MTQPLLHFTHGNSYPSRAYGRLLAELGRDYDVRVTEMLGHDPRFPVDDNWASLVDELIARLEQNVEQHRQPAILVGHSLGGAVSALAAWRRPDLARCVVMLDSPVVAGWRAQAWRVVKALGLGRRLSPGGIAERRRDRWPSRAAAHAHFAAKPMFQAWAPGALDDYLEHGLVDEEGGGVRLRFEREVEAAIYASLPHDMGKLLRKPFPVPIGFVAGTRSNELRQAGLAATRALVGENFVSIDGTHLYPMENPALTAQLTRAMVQRLLGETAPVRMAAALPTSVST